MPIINAKMQSGKDAQQIIEHYEGCHLTAYLCPAKKPTIGFGHTGPDVTLADVKNKKTITREHAEHLYRIDVLKSENAIKAFVTVPVSQQQFDALTSFIFNVGRNAFAGSTLTRRLNAGFYGEVPDQLKRWIYGDPKQPPLPGLIKRRNTEATLWSTGKVVFK